MSLFLVYGYNFTAKVRRLYDIANVLASIHLIEKVNQPSSFLSFIFFLYN